MPRQIDVVGNKPRPGPSASGHLPTHPRAVEQEAGSGGNSTAIGFSTDGGGGRKRSSDTVERSGIGSGGLETTGGAGLDSVGGFDRTVGAAMGMTAGGIGSAGNNTTFRSTPNEALELSGAGPGKKVLAVLVCGG